MNPRPSATRRTRRLALFQTSPNLDRTIFDEFHTASHPSLELLLPSIMPVDSINKSLSRPVLDRQRITQRPLPRIPIHQLPVRLASSSRVAFADSTQVPGVKCPACLNSGIVIWVIPGKRCPRCRAEVNG